MTTKPETISLIQTEKQLKTVNALSSRRNDGESIVLEEQNDSDYDACVVWKACKGDVENLINTYGMNPYLKLSKEVNKSVVDIFLPNSVINNVMTHADILGSIFSLRAHMSYFTSYYEPREANHQEIANINFRFMSLCPKFIDQSFCYGPLNELLHDMLKFLVENTIMISHAIHSESVHKVVIGMASHMAETLSHGSADISDENARLIISLAEEYVVSMKDGDRLDYSKASFTYGLKMLAPSLAVFLNSLIMNGQNCPELRSLLIDVSGSLQGAESDDAYLAVRDMLSTILSNMRSEVDFERFIAIFRAIFGGMNFQESLNASFVAMRADVFSGAIVNTIALLNLVSDRRKKAEAFMRFLDYARAQTTNESVKVFLTSARNMTFLAV